MYRVFFNEKQNTRNFDKSSKQQRLISDKKRYFRYMFVGKFALFQE